MLPTNRYVWISEILLAIMILPVLSLPVQDRIDTRQETEQVMVFLVIDDSGSMEANDPFQLRCTAAQLFISLLDDEDRVAIVRFATEGKILTDGWDEVGGQREDLLDKVQSCPSDGYTNMKAALDMVHQVLLDSNVPGTRSSVILLTDGKPEIQNAYKGYEEEIIGLAASLQMPIYSIALTSAADRNFLSRISSETGGYVVSAQGASDLLDAYLRIFGDIKDRTILGDDLADTPGNIQFQIEPALAPYVEKVSFVLGTDGQNSGQLIAPDGEVVDSDGSISRFSYKADGRFSITTIAHPSAGVWKYALTGRGQVMGRAILYSRLRLEISSPVGAWESGEPIPIVVRMVEERENGGTVQIIGESEFTAEITLPDRTVVSLDRFYDDGTHGDQTAGDGNYTRDVAGLSTAGEYHLMVRGKKGPVPVEQAIDFEVVTFPNMILDGPDGIVAVGDQPVPVRVHFVGWDPVSVHLGDIVAKITYPSGNVLELPLSGADAVYSSTFYPVEDGNHHVRVELRDAKFLGLEYQDVIQGEFTVQLIHAVQVGRVDTELDFGCLASVPTINLHLPVSSLRKERISLTLGQLPDFSLLPNQVELQPGEQQLDLSLIPPNGKIPSLDAYQGYILLSATDETTFSPHSSIQFSFPMPSLWSRCRKPISWGVLMIVVSVLGGIGVMKKVRASVAPPCVTGTLRWRQVGADPVTAREIDLTVYRRNNLSLGSHPDRDVVLRDGELEDHHATILAERTLDGIQVFLEPLAPIKKGYGVIQGRIPLRHADQFIVGRLNFQYLSDSGE